MKAAKLHRHLAPVVKLHREPYASCTDTHLDEHTRLERYDVGPVQSSHVYHFRSKDTCPRFPKPRGRNMKCGSHLLLGSWNVLGLA